MLSHWGMTERLSGSTGIPQVEYVFCELPELRDRKPATTEERWAALFSAAPLLTPETAAKEPFTPEQRAALELANEASFTDNELEAYRKSRAEVWQMVQSGRDSEARGEARGLAAGRAEAVAAIARLFVRKLGRALAEDERATLATRLAALSRATRGPRARPRRGGLVAWLAEQNVD